MLRRTYDGQVCSMARSLEVVGERWTLLIVRDALLGYSRFEEFRGRLDITGSVLASRLHWLVAAGILQRVPYQTRPTRYDYRLTPKGQDLAAVVLSLMQWGDQYLVGEAGPPRIARHDGCGGRVETQVSCLGCAQEVAADHVVVTYPTQHFDGPPNPTPT